MKRGHVKSRTLHEAIEFFNVTPVDQWKPKDLIEYFYATQSTYCAQPFWPSYKMEYRVATGKLLKLFGPQQTKLMIDGIFAFRDELFTTPTLLQIWQNLTITTLLNAKMRPIFLRAIASMKHFESMQQEPHWKKVPQNQWTPEDWEAWRETTRRPTCPEDDPKVALKK